MKSVILSGGDSIKQTRSCSALYHLLIEVCQYYIFLRIFNIGLNAAAAAAAKSLQSCPTLCDPIDSSPPGSPFPGILQARTLEWVAITFSYA